MIAELALAAALAGPACPGTVVAQRGRVAVTESASHRFVCDRATGRRVRIDARGRVLRLAVRGGRAAVVTGGRRLIPLVQVAEPGRPVLRSRLPFRGRVVRLGVLPSGAAVYEAGFGHIDLVDAERTRVLDELGRDLRVRGSRFSWRHAGTRVERRVDAPFPATLPRDCVIPSTGEMAWRAPGVAVYELVEGGDRRYTGRVIGCAGTGPPVEAGRLDQTTRTYVRFEANTANGPFVAFYRRAFRTLVDVVDSYEVVDVRSGAHTATGAISSGADTSVTSSSNPVVSRTGALAWAVDIEGSTPEVRVADAGGTRVIDRGRDIDLESLVLDGTRLTWTRAGVAHEAELP